MPMENFRPEQRVNFATLTPANGLAARCFDALRDRVATQPQQPQHHAHFIQQNETIAVLPRSPENEPSPQISFSSNGTTEADLHVDERAPAESSGYFVLAFIPEMPPLNTKAGWLAGTGRFDKDEINGKVDLLLPPPVSDDNPNRPRSDLPYPRHVAFRFDSLGRLSLTARHNRVVLNGDDLRSNESRLLPGYARIGIAQLKFVFRFIVPDSQQPAYQRALRRYLLRYHRVEAPPEITSVTPSQNDIMIGDWRVHGIVETTASSLIQAASNLRTGQAVAVKRLLRTSRSAKSVDKELEVYDRLLPGLRQHKYGIFVMKMHSVLLGRASTSNVQETYLLWEPLGRVDFGRFRIGDLFHSIAEPIKLQLFCQALLGLKALHDIGWIHRDLKPQNIAVVSFDPPHAILIDLGIATERRDPGHLPTIGACGTVGYLAPELENAVFASHYGQKVDIWSMGAVGVFMMDLGRIPWSTTRNMFVPELEAMHPSFTVFREYLESLERESTTSFKGLLFQVLRIRPRDRPDVQDVLSYPFLQSAFAAANRWLAETAESGSKRRRE